MNTIWITSLGKKLEHVPFHTEGQSSLTTSLFKDGLPIPELTLVSICI